jgi:hypothetical protein
MLRAAVSESVPADALLAAAASSGVPTLATPIATARTAMTPTHLEKLLVKTFRNLLSTCLGQVPGRRLSVGSA